MSRISLERLARQVLLATTTGKQLRGRRRPWWHDYISDFAWSRLGVNRGEPSDIAVDCEVFRVHLGLLPPRPSQTEKLVRKLIWTLKLSIYKIVFSFLPKVNVVFK